jgi:hypothetical protein
MGSGRTSITLHGLAAHYLFWPNKNPTSGSGALLVQSLLSELSSIRSLCSTDHRLRAHQRKAGSRTVFRLSPQQIAEQSCNRRVRRHRLGWESPWAVLRSVSCLGQFVQKLIPQLGALRLISQQKPDLAPCSLRPSPLLWTQDLYWLPG